MQPTFLLLFSDHYRFIAERYDYLYKEVDEGLIPVLIKTLGLKPGHVVVDIGSGTGFIAEKLFKLSGLSNPIWCVDPSPEMQEVARHRKGLYPVQKTAEEFFWDPHISERFDRVIAAGSAHHFVNPDAVYKGIIRSLRPGGIFVLSHTLKLGHPFFKSVAKLVGESFEREWETQVSCMRTINLDAKVSHEDFSYPWSVTKSKLYEMFRCRYISILEHFSDDQIEQGIKELENELFKDVKDDDLINCDRSLAILKAQKSCQ